MAARSLEIPFPKQREMSRLWRFNEQVLGKVGLQEDYNPERSIREDVCRLIFGFEKYDSWKKVVAAILADAPNQTRELQSRNLRTAMKELWSDARFPMIKELVKIFRDEDTPETGRFPCVSNIQEEDGKGREKKQELIGRVLLVASDAQTVTGMSLCQNCILVFTYCRRECLGYHRNGPAAVFKSLPSAHHI